MIKQRIIGRLNDFETLIRVKNDNAHRCIYTMRYVMLYSYPRVKQWISKQAIFVREYIFRIYKSIINNTLMAPVDRDVSGIFMASSRCNGQDLKCVVCMGTVVNSAPRRTEKTAVRLFLGAIRHKSVFQVKPPDRLRIVFQTNIHGRVSNSL